MSDDPVAANTTREAADELANNARRRSTSNKAERSYVDTAPGDWFSAGVTRVLRVGSDSREFDGSLAARVNAESKELNRLQLSLVAATRYDYAMAA